MDALTQVREEHRRLQELLERCARPGQDADERGALVDQLQAALRHHVDQEEPILYMIFRERAQPAGVDLAPLERVLGQHRQIERLSQELADAGPGDGTGEAGLAALTEKVHAHLDDEDATVLTAVEDLIDDDTLMELGRRMEQRDRVLESRRELAATMVPGGRRGRRIAAALGGLAAAGTALVAILARRRKPPPSPPPTGWRRIRRR